MINAEIKLDPGDLITYKVVEDINVVYYLISKISKEKWKCIRIVFFPKGEKKRGDIIYTQRYTTGFYGKNYFLQKRKSS